MIPLVIVALATHVSSRGGEVVPDSDLFRTVVQGGSFAVLVLILVWGIFRLEPRVRETMEKKDSLQAETIQHMVTESANTQKETTRQFAEACAKMMVESRLAMETIIKRHDEQVLKLTQECKEERKEWVDAMGKELESLRIRMEKEGDMNRKSRHDFADQIQKILGDVLEKGEERGRKGRIFPDAPDAPDSDARRRREQL